MKSFVSVSAWEKSYLESFIVSRFGSTFNKAVGLDEKQVRSLLMSMRDRLLVDNELFVSDLLTNKIREALNRKERNKQQNEF